MIFVLVITGRLLSSVKLYLGGLGSNSSHYCNEITNDLQRGWNIRSGHLNRGQDSSLSLVQQEHNRHKRACCRGHHHTVQHTSHQYCTVGLLVDWEKPTEPTGLLLQQYSTCSVHDLDEMTWWAMDQAWREAVLLSALELNPARRDGGTKNKPVFHCDKHH